MDFWEGKKVVVTGGAGFLGTHIVKLLRERKASVFVPRSSKYDLRNESGAIRMLRDAGDPSMIIHCAATCGGIGLNRAHPYLLCYENLITGTQLIHLAIKRRIPKFVCLGTVCCYPKFAPVPFREEALWDGYPEETNAPYALAKKMLLVLLQAARKEHSFNGIFLMPTNLYGPGDNFNPQSSHVIPALVRKFVEAKEQGRDEVVLWGTGRPTRDFLFVRDAAEGIVLAAEKYNLGEPMNLGTGEQVMIHALAHHIQNLVGWNGKTVWDLEQPDGQPKRGVSPARAEATLGWKAKTPLLDGLKETIEWYLENR